MTQVLFIESELFMSLQSSSSQQFTILETGSVGTDVRGWSLMNSFSTS